MDDPTRRATLRKTAAMGTQHNGKLGIVAHFTTRRSLRSALAGVWALALAGCASLGDVAVGTSLDQVVAQFGEPDVRCPADGGGENLVWSTQPYGQYAWHIRTDPQGRVGAVRAALTDANFQRLRTGVWTQHDVVCAFGSPARRSSVGLPSVRQQVWSYRYRQEGVWNSLMHVYFGRDGARVTHFHPGPDPLFDPEWRILGD